MKVWDCKVVLPDDVELPDCADVPMRKAVSAAVEQMTGRPPSGIFSGWGGRLTAGELEIIGMVEATTEMKPLADGEIVIDELPTG